MICNKNWRVQKNLLSFQIYEKYLIELELVTLMVKSMYFLLRGHRLKTRGVDSVCFRKLSNQITVPMEQSLYAFVNLAIK